MVAFTNTYGGRILLGVDDEGNIVGVKRENIDEWIANISSNNCQPTILPQISRIRVNGNIVIIIEVQKGVEPHKVSDGRYYIRVGSINREMSTFELARLFQQRQLVFFEETPVNGTSTRDLDTELLRDYFLMNNGFDLDELSYEERNNILFNADILNEEGRLTTGGLLIFGKSPQRYMPSSGIIFAHFVGVELSDTPRDRKRIAGAIKDLVDKTASVIKLSMLVESKIEGLERKENVPLPDIVLREAVVNAVIHWDYSLSGTEIRVFLFDDRLEVRSPGRLPNTVTADKMKVGRSVARNPMLVKYMENIRYMDRLGRGIPMILREMKRLGRREPLLEESDGEFVLILYL